MQMNKPKISPDFTIEDIHKIREANEERRQAMTKEAYRAEVRADALFIHLSLSLPCRQTSCYYM